MTDWQTEIWLDTADVYRLDLAVTTTFAGDNKRKGNPYRVVSTANPGKKFDTPNYDEHSGPAGMSKENNIMTSDRWQMDIGVDCQSADYLLIKKGGAGTGQWFEVKGDPKKRTILNFQDCYLVTSTPPLMLAGAWNS